MSFSLIACVGKRGELGASNHLVFHIPEDMVFFKRTTTGHAVLMGRKTWESIGRPLPHRQNFVVSRHPLDLPEGVKLVPDLSEFIAEHSKTDEELFIIGGANLFAQTLPFTKTLYLTEVDAAAPEADAFFPPFDREKFNSKVLDSGSDAGLSYQIIKYERKPL